MANQTVKIESVSFFAKIFRFFIFVVCLVLIWAIFQISKPQDLQDIDGYKDAGAPSRDLENVLNLAVGGNYAVTLTELEINQLLATKLISKQGGMLADSASIKQVLVRLKQDLAEVIVVREVFGRELTSSMYLQFEQNQSDSKISTQLHLHNGALNETSVLPKVGGRMGQLSVPQGFLLAIMPDMEKIAAALSPEITLGFDKMARFKIENKNLILDPRRPTKNASEEETPF